MTTPFVVLTTQRTGSTYFVDLLDSHPGIRCRSELFLAGAQGTPTWGGAKDLAFWEVHDLCYEDLGGCPPVRDDVVRFLGAAPRELRSRLEKVIRRDRPDVVMNFPAVRATLTGTPHEWMLDDEGRPPA